MSHANIWAPWRMAYLRSITEKEGDTSDNNATSGNFFRHYWLNPDQDDANYVVHRNQMGLILLNRYPYSNGHLLVALGDPAPTLLEYDDSQRAAFWSLLENACQLVRRTLNPQGLNIGINVGESAGAGIPEHLHAHVVPRWGGDTNFMTTIGNIRVSPDALEAVAAEYRAAIERGALQE